MRTALIVDHDLGFVLWLAEALGTAGYHAYPAESVADAGVVLGKLRDGIDLAIVNPTLPRVGSLVKSLTKSSHPPDILALEPEPAESLAGPLGVTVWLRKPDAEDESAKSEWLEAFRKHLAADVGRRTIPQAVTGSGVLGD